MRSSYNIRRELKDLEKLIAEDRFSSDSENNPDIAEGDEIYTELLDELKTAFTNEQKHSIHYIVSNAEKYKSISIEKISNSLKAFQHVINQICRIVYNDNPANVKLGLITTFPSSFGLMLATENQDRELISRTFYTFDYLFDILNKLNNEETIYKTLKEELTDKRILKSFLYFYKIQGEENIDLSIRWGDSYSDTHTIEIKKERSRFIYQSLKKYARIPDEQLEITGVIKGISLVKNKIEYLTEEYGLIIVSATEDQIMEIEKYFDNEVCLGLILTQKSNALMDEVHQSWKLIEVTE